MSDKSNGDYQRAVGKLVDNNVHYCISSLVSHLSKSDGFFDEFLHLLESKPDSNAFLETFEYSDYDDKDILESLDWDCIDSLDEWHQVFDHFGIEYPAPGEIYEHWIVSDWFADRLEAKGESIEKDLYGLTVWGRGCSGQAILLDGVVCEIYDELHKGV